jgi:hypothetical protein
MKKRLFWGVGTVVLAIAGIAAGRASAKFSTPTKLYATAGTSTCIPLVTGSIPGISASFNTVASNSQAQLITSSGSHLNLWATSGCTTKKVYYN